MNPIDLYRKLLWPIAAVTSAIVLALSVVFSYLSGGSDWWRIWISIPLIPFLPIILGAFIYSVSRVAQALNRYEIEAKACEFVSRVIASHTIPSEIQAELGPVTKGDTAIGKRILHAFESGDLDTAFFLAQLPQPMDIDEDKTFGELQFWRSALLLLGLLSTVIFFAKAFASVTTSDLKDLAFLIDDLQRALTMTMAGIATSVVLGGMATRLFDIQQNLKLRVEDLTALMLPRVLPRYEKGTKEEPGPALVLEKLQDFLREVEDWKSGLGSDVDRLSQVLGEHREILASLPAISFPKSFSKLSATLSQVSTTMTETRSVIERALEILSEDRNIDVNSIIKLLMEIRVDSERIKTSQTTLLDNVIPKQTKALEQLTDLNSSFQKISEGLKQTTEKQEELIKTNRGIQTELLRLSQPKDERVVAKLQELLTAMKGLQSEGISSNQSLREVVSSISKLPSVLNLRIARPENSYPRSYDPRPRDDMNRQKDWSRGDGRSLAGRVRDWFFGER